MHSGIVFGFLLECCWVPWYVIDSLEFSEWLWDVPDWPLDSWLETSELRDCGNCSWFFFFEAFDLFRRGFEGM